MKLELLTGSTWRGTLAILAFAIAGTAIGAAALAQAGDDLTPAVGLSVALATLIALLVNRAVSDSRRRIRKIRTARAWVSSTARHLHSTTWPRPSGVHSIA